jgi:hypothetical protein
VLSEKEKPVLKRLRYRLLGEQKGFTLISSSS